MKIDAKDKAILAILQRNSRLTTKEIAKKTQLPITTVHNRLKKLKEENIIEQFTIKLNYKALGKPLLVFRTSNDRNDSINFYKLSFCWAFLI